MQYTKGIGAVAVDACLIGVVALTMQVAVADETGPKPEDARAALAEWVEVERVISREKRDLALAKETLQQRIDVVEREIGSLRKKIAEAETSIAETEKKRDDLREENERLKRASDALKGTLGTLERDTMRLLDRLPEPIRDRVKPLSQRIPDGTRETKLTVSERFQNVIGILNEVNKYNQNVTVTSEVRSLPDGTSAEVTSLYVGIGRGYYVNGSGTIAGTGASDAEGGWTWRGANDAGAAILQAVAILQNEAVADFVQLPVEID